MTFGSTWHSALNPAGPQAAHIARLSWGLFGTTTIVFLIVLAALGWALLKGMRHRRDSSPIDTATDVTLTRAVGAAVVVTVLIVIGLLVSSIWTDQLLVSLHASNAASIIVTGHQWWWEVEYENAVASRRVKTANEIHIPVGRPVALNVTSTDVIHSFWVPALHGKRDLVPGYTTTTWLQADRAGTYRGQCAEFCGKQHAHMAFSVVAEREDDFQRWLDGQRKTALPPSTELQQRGLNLFLTRPCSACHTVHGTPAHGQVGPDLTHVASRGTIGARTLENSHAQLAAWIQNAQGFKPGTQMPPHALPSEDVEALVAYLQSLQ